METHVEMGVRKGRGKEHGDGARLLTLSFQFSISPSFDICLTILCTTHEFWVSFSCL